MENKLLHLQRDPKKWSKEEAEESMQFNFMPYFFTFSQDRDYEVETIASYYNEYVFNINGKIGRAVIPEQPKAMVHMSKSSVDSTYDHIKALFNRDDSNIYIIFVSEVEARKNSLSFLDHKKVVLIEVPPIVTANDRMMELLTLGEEKLKETTHNNCA